MFDLSFVAMSGMNGSSELYGKQEDLLNQAMLNVRIVRRCLLFHVLVVEQVSGNIRKYPATTRNVPEITLTTVV